MGKSISRLLMLAERYESRVLVESSSVEWRILNMGSGLSSICVGG